VPALARLQRASVPLYEQVRAASSCQNEVILPWTRDRIEDKTFPATGPVYQESTKPLPGLAGESRSGDANGQWFRVLAQPGLYSTEVGNGMKMLSQEPIMGANPPKPAGRPPLRPDVPCETQEPPDLRTRVDTSAESHEVEISDSPDVQRRLREAQERAVKWLEQAIEDQRLGGVLEASNAPITRDLLPKLRELGATKP